MVRSCCFATLKAGVVLAGLLLCASQCRAALVLADTFSYANGSLITNSAFLWTTHSAQTGETGQTQVVSGRVQLSQNQSEDVAAALTNGPYSSGALYASFVVNFSALPNGTGNYFAHLKDNGTTSFRARVFATTNGANAGTFRVGAANAASSPNSVIPTDLVLGSNYTLVVRYSNAVPAITLWLNPASEETATNRADAADATSAVGITMFALRQSLSSGNGMGVLFFDNLLVGTAFADVLTNAAPPSNSPPVITVQPEDQIVTVGSNAMFSVTATGTPSPTYQWQFFGTNLPGATSSALVLTNVATAQAGPYVAVVTNVAGGTNSRRATLTVSLLPPAATFSLLTYNTHGNHIEDWSTNSPQVQAIGRQMMYLNPDVVTFQEIPYTNTWQMTNFAAAYLPGYALATNSVTDGWIRSVILSRFPIMRSQSWLPHADLNPFGYTNSNFTRDLFEAQISVPGLAQPVHVFTTHLKSGLEPDDSAKRAAEASAISNYFVTGFLTTNASHPYVLTGDLNESDTNELSIQRLVSAPTGLQLTTPVNPYTFSELTHSIRGSLNKRYDYILPGAFLFTNIASSQVFRTDLLPNPPPPLQTNDDITASDHLPVMMTFSKPYDDLPFRLLSIVVSNQVVTLTWEAENGRQYRVNAASNLTTWTALASNLTATGTNYTFSTNVGGTRRFFRVYRVP